MASLQCSSCGYGIHYHSEPNGIEYTYISNESWNKICSSKFDAKNKEYSDEIKKYPKLYRTDTIEEDFYEDIIKVWRCSECGTLHAFDKKGNVKNVYVKQDLCINYGVCEEGIFFDDYSWDDITEKAISNHLLADQKPCGYVKIYENGISISRDKERETYAAYIIK